MESFKGYWELDNWILEISGGLFRLFGFDLIWRKRMGCYGAIKHFTDIEAWKLGWKIRLVAYRIVEALPPREKYDLSSQMRRAAISITANIAESPA